MTDEAKKPRPGDLDYVGYKHPPKKSQFQKGKSGNPGGRPSAAKPGKDVTDYERAFSKKVGVSLNGKRVSRTRRELGYEGFADAVARRDPTALKLFFALEAKFGHLREPAPKLEGTGVLVARPPLTEAQWERLYGGPQPQQPWPLMDALRAQLFKDNDMEEP
jgi:hypothetical protein